MPIGTTEGLDGHPTPINTMAGLDEPSTLTDPIDTTAVLDKHFTPTNTAALCRLPPEVMFNILLSVDGPKDLYSFIRASKSCYSTFMMSPLRLVSSVIRNFFLPNALHHALALCEVSMRIDQHRAKKAQAVSSAKDRKSSRASSHEPNQSRQVNIASLWGKKLEDWTGFVDRYFGGYFEFPSDWASMKRLCRIARQIDQHVGAYAEKALSILYYGTRERFPRCIPTRRCCISASERTRIQRAFLRFELYNKLCVIDTDSAAKSTSARGMLNFLKTRGYFMNDSTMFHSFLARMAPWEVEEISSAWMYVRSEIYGFYEDINLKLIQHLNPSRIKQEWENLDEVELKIGGPFFYPYEDGSNDDDSNHKPSSKKDSNKNEDGEMGNYKNGKEQMVYVASEMGNFGGLSFFSRHGRQFAPNVLRALPLLGLDYLDALNAIEDAHMREYVSRVKDSLYHNDAIYHQRPCFPTVLLYGCHHPWRRSPSSFTERKTGINGSEAEGKDTTKKITEDTLLPNRGWVLFADSRSVYIQDRYWERTTFTFLRERGYVFWDSDRVIRKDERTELLAAKNGNVGWYDKECAYPLRTSAQEECRLLKVPKSRMDEAIELFGAPSYAERFLKEPV